MTASQSKRACVQCHTVNEKCRWLTDRDTCERCWRLKRTCRTRKLLTKAGRKPRCARGRAMSPRLPKCIVANSPCPIDSDAVSPHRSCLTICRINWKAQSRADQWRCFPDLNRVGEEAISLIMTLQKRMRVVDHFVLGPSFHAVCPSGSIQGGPDFAAFSLETANAPSDWFDLRPCRSPSQCKPRGIRSFEWPLKG